MVSTVAVSSSLARFFLVESRDLDLRSFVTRAKSVPLNDLFFGNVFFLGFFLFSFAFDSKPNLSLSSENGALSDVSLSSSQH